MLWWLFLLTAWAVPAPPGSDVPWLPLEHELVSVRLTAGADPSQPGVAEHLERGWQVGASSRPWISNVLRDHPDLRDPSRVWRVPSTSLSALRGAGVVEAAWGHPEPVPPPSDTPNFDSDQALLDPPPEGVGVAWLRGWPGAAGDGVRVSVIEYAFDPDHEAFQSNPPEVGPGQSVRQFEYHGNAVFGLIGSGDDGFGVTGIAPQVQLRIVYPFTPSYDVAEALLLAAQELAPGDVLLIEQQMALTPGLGPVSADPATFDAIALATAAGITVVEPTGNGGVDLDAPFFEGWFDPSNDHGGIMIGASNAAHGRPANYSGHGARVDLHTRSGHLHAPYGRDGEPDLYFPEGDWTRAYTARFGGTSGAAAVVAGACVALQGVAIELRGAPLPPDTLRDGLKISGRPLSTAPGSLPRIGVPLDSRRAAQVLLSP